MPPTLGYAHYICANILASSSIRTCNSELLRVICLLLCGFSLSFFSYSCSKLIFYILHYFFLIWLPPPLCFLLLLFTSHLRNKCETSSSTFLHAFVLYTWGGGSLFYQNGILYARVTSCFSCFPMHNILSS